MQIRTTNMIPGLEKMRVKDLNLFILSKGRVRVDFIPVYLHGQKKTGTNGPFNLTEEGRTRTKGWKLKPDKFK